MDTSSIFAVAATNKTEKWVDAFRKRAPELRVEALDDVANPDDVHWIATWETAPGRFASLKNLRAVFAMGAGVEKFLGRDDLSDTVPLIRLNDAGMAEQMFDYALYAALTVLRSFDQYARDQAEFTWKPRAPRSRASLRVTVLGLGTLGGYVATHLAQHGFTVSGWSRTEKTLPGVRWHGALDMLLGETDLLVSILPLTDETRGLLNARRLALLPRGAYVVNAGRGDQLDLDALLNLLDSGHLRGAQLDVFPIEPLPATHPAWENPTLRITPHAAAFTLIDEAVDQMVTKLAQFERGETVEGTVDRSRSY
ncbi:2-hydroxyacid dehydrogenase [Roseiterribacter gracilis]|uniref:Glyoxylate/hydroxypyruvate reductase A n=1 Tax=Roseiterribacter gracilis TaxID=2812848 RepID=A0A8S8XAN4_9PROT|nr:glyoxylate/hydroxypyruvate reductase A [Rhodospirillales bacterium TMPK1]